MSPVDELTPVALSLPVEERALLVERLLASLDDLDETESDRLWGEEALRRLVAHRNGWARARSAEEVYASAERLLGASLHALTRAGPRIAQR